MFYSGAVIACLYVIEDHPHRPENLLGSLRSYYGDAEKNEFIFYLRILGYS